MKRTVKTIKTKTTFTPKYSHKMVEKVKIFAKTELKIKKKLFMKIEAYKMGLTFQTNII